MHCKLIVSMRDWIQTSKHEGQGGWGWQNNSRTWKATLEGRIRTIWLHPWVPVPNWNCERGSKMDAFCIRTSYLNCDTFTKPMTVSHLALENKHNGQGPCVDLVALDLCVDLWKPSKQLPGSILQLYLVFSQSCALYITGFTLSLIYS